jgi:molybdopterin synthase sulfur carrier subunit
MATLRLFAAAREAAATSVETIDAATVGTVLAEAGARHGAHFVAVLGLCRVWLNGEPADLDASVTDRDEIAVLPPVSGGCGAFGVHSQRCVAGVWR